MSEPRPGQCTVISLSLGKVIFCKAVSANAKMFIFVTPPQLTTLVNPEPLNPPIPISVTLFGIVRFLKLATF